MQQTRRTWLRATAAAMAGVGLAGCQGSDDDDEDPTPTETGEENGQGAVQSGEAYVHTFETAGEHEYVCIPHEAAGMVGTVVVE